MADHVRLMRDLTLVAQGLSIKSKPTLGFGGSYNYGKMRIAAAIEQAHLIKDPKLANQAREMWLDNEREQLSIGHWCHREQCEQLCPLPHSEFILASECVVWRGALRRGDQELAASCEASISRSLALWHLFSLGGIVCAPGARAKDIEDGSNGMNMDQWRNRPAEAMLARVFGGKKPKYNSLSVQMFDEAMKLAVNSKPRIIDVAGVKLRVPINYTSLPGGGYVAWMNKPEDFKLGDPLSGVIHRVKGKPELYYDWTDIPDLPEKFQTIGA